jgi:hypothetical protein
MLDPDYALDTFPICPLPHDSPSIFRFIVSHIDYLFRLEFGIAKPLMS